MIIQMCDNCFSETHKIYECIDCGRVICFWCIWFNCDDETNMITYPYCQECAKSNEGLC